MVSVSLDELSRVTSNLGDTTVYLVELYRRPQRLCDVPTPFWFSYPFCLALMLGCLCNKNKRPVPSPDQSFVCNTHLQ